MKTLLQKSPGSRRVNCPETKSCALGQAIWLALLCLAVWAVGPRASAQTPAGLDLQLYAGLSITSAVGTTHPVGQKLANPWGLYDMHGNVEEWCQDWWSDSLPGGIAIDPQGPATSSYRVIRGGEWGNWLDRARGCRSAFRSGIAPDCGYDGFGFRVVLAPGQP